VSSFLGIYSWPPLDVACHMASPDSCYMFTPVRDQPLLLASAHAGAADNLYAANQGVSNGHRL